MRIETVRPRITAYESILLIFSELVRRGRTILRQDTLVRNLYKFRDLDSTRLLFEDIVFNNHSDAITSVDVEDSLIKLQTYGAIGKLNPAYEKILIYISREEADSFINSFDVSFVNAAVEVSEAFEQ